MNCNDQVLEDGKTILIPSWYKMSGMYVFVLQAFRKALQAIDFETMTSKFDKGGKV